MLHKNRRTLDIYKKVGAEMRLLKTLLTKVLVDGDAILKQRDIDDLDAAYNKIGEVCGAADGYMFKDHPEVSDEYLHVFYGGTNAEPVDDLEKELLDIAREIAVEITHPKRSDHQ